VSRTKLAMVLKSQGRATAAFNARGVGDDGAPAAPEILLQTQIVLARGAVADGSLITAVGPVWRRIAEEIARDPAFLVEFARNPRAFEEFIAATYEQTGEWDRVILTPRSGDRGRDVIVERDGFGSIRFLEQTKAYTPGHLVTHDDVRALVGVLSMDHNASKVIITTTSDFQPGVCPGRSSVLSCRIRWRRRTASSCGSGSRRPSAAKQPTDEPNPDGLAANGRGSCDVRAVNRPGFVRASRRRVWRSVLRVRLKPQAHPDSQCGPRLSLHVHHEDTH
jgi:restriction system protein